MHKGGPNAHSFNFIFIQVKAIDSDFQLISKMLVHFKNVGRSFSLDKNVKHGDFPLKEENCANSTGQVIFLILEIPVLQLHSENARPGSECCEMLVLSSQLSI